MKKEGHSLKKTRLWLKNILLTIFGTLVLSLGTALFLLPNHLIAGGISGLAILLEHIFKSISVERWISMLTVGLFLLGLFLLKSDFAVKTLLSTIIYPVGIALFSPLKEWDALASFFVIREEKDMILTLLIASILGGVFIGVGCAITFLGGGSTGGVDVIAFLICKLFPSLRASKVIFFVDATIILLGIFITSDIVKSVFGILSAFVGAIMIEKIFLSAKK